MSLILKQIFALIKLLNSETDTKQISMGIALGLILGFSPLTSLQSLITILILLFFRIQIGAALISSFFFSFIAYLIDPLSDQLGRSILESESLNDLFTKLYNMPFIPFTKFYNSIVMGSGILAALLIIPVYILSEIFIKKYREKILSRFKDTKFWKLVRATSLYQWYMKYESIKN